MRSRFASAIGRRKGDRSPSVVIIGAGLGGLCAAIHLKRAGFDDVVIIDAAEGVGGTWRDNVYPGAAVDVPAQLYSYSFRLNARWSRLYPLQPEILDYIEGCVDHFGLRRHLRLATSVTEAVWSEGNDSWTIRTSGGDVLVADVLVSAVGLLSSPSRPAIAGLETFEGHAFHSSRWDRSVELRNRRVAVIGTGSSGAQIVPAIAAMAEHVYVFQREPHWVMPRNDRPIGDRESRVYRLAPVVMRAQRAKWFFQYERFTVKGNQADASQRAAAMANGRKYIQAAVPDPELRERITPDYPLGCKRVVFSDDYYASLARDDVELITDRIAHITPKAIVLEDGTTHDVDLIVLATGFEATSFMSKIRIVGQGGKLLNHAWSDGAEAYLGMTVADFPNMFVMYGPNSNMRNSIIFGHECQARYLTKAVTALSRRRRRRIEVREDVMNRYNYALQVDLENSVWTAGCNNYFRSSTGKVVTQWPHTAIRYWRLTRRFRLDDFESTPYDNRG